MNGDGFSSFDSMGVCGVLENGKEVPISSKDLMYRGRRQGYDVYFSFYGWFAYGPRVCPGCKKVHTYWEWARTERELHARIVQMKNEIKASSIENGSPPSI